MAEITSSEPILRDVPINSQASGFEAIGKAFGRAAQAAHETGVTLANEESNSMMMLSLSDAEKWKNQVAESIITDPENAERYIQSGKEGFEQIKQASYVNARDRKQLNYHIDQLAAASELHGVQLQADQSKRMAAFAHFASWKDELKLFTDAALTDHEGAEKLRESMLSKLKGLVQVGALTPIQAANSINDMNTAVKYAQQTYDAYGRGDMTPHEYHATMAHPFETNKTGNTNEPINASTQWLIAHHAQNKSYKMAQSDINNGHLPDAEAWSSFNEHQRDRLLRQINGVRDAQGLVNSGGSYESIKNESNNLNTRADFLSPHEEGKKNYLDKYIKDLEAGDYLSVMSRTPAGGSIMQQYAMNETAIRASARAGTLTPEAAQDALRKNKNDMINNAVSYGEAHKIPKQYVNPIPPEDINAVEKSFSAGGNPDDLFVVASNYSKSNHGYISQQIKNPVHRMVFDAVTNAEGSLKPQDLQDLIAANQPHKYDEILNMKATKVSGHELKDADLASYAVTSLKDTMRLTANLHGNNDAVALNNGMVQSVVNLSKYLAAKNGDSSMKNWHGYVDTANKIYKAAFMPKSGLNYMVSKNQLPRDLTDPQLNALAHFAVTKGISHLSGNKEDVRIRQLNDINPLTMTITSTNDLIAQDSLGNVAYAEPLTDLVVKEAERVYSERRKETKPFTFMPNVEQKPTSKTTLKSVIRKVE